MAGVKKDDPRIYGDRFHLLEHKNFTHFAQLEDQVNREHLLRPEFWSHIAGKVLKGDMIHARNDSFTFWAEMLVIDVGSGFVKVHILRWEDIEKADHTDAGTSDDYDILFKGSERLHVVSRKSDGIVVQEKLRTKNDAVAWLNEFIGKKTPDLKAA